MPRSPQGHPVVIQAGSSNRGKTFSARWAETVFVGYEDLEHGKREPWSDRGAHQNLLSPLDAQVKQSHEPPL